MKYFYENDINEPIGPVDIEKLKLTNIKSSTLIWKEGMENWSEAKNFEELKEYFLLPPPLPDKKKSNNINNESDKNISKNKAPSIWSYKGRMRRSAYFGYAFLLNILIQVIIYNLKNVNEDDPILLLGLLVIPILYLYIIITIKRLHDMNFCGWFFFISFIPLLNLILVFWDGIEGTNKYGLDPKRRKSRLPKK